MSPETTFDDQISYASSNSGWNVSVLRSGTLTPQTGTPSTYYFPIL
ncbi:MAG TPA: hypothetical protein VFS43_01175 [Polyangiaceae bacterium]|nr:hypothetical protein [Polyangiaceae bacterium]